jgi:hypothetical protein
MRPHVHSSLGILSAGLIALFTVNSLWGQTTSDARIVRLSFVEGDVTVERPDVQTWAEAPVNTPLQQGFKLSTGENSFAEMQFEDGGTVRLGQLGLLKFTELALAPNGGLINHVDLREGYATFHPLPSRLGETLKVGTPLGMLTAHGGTQFRVDLDQGMERVEVIDGEVEVQSSLGDSTLEKDSVLIMQPGAPDPTAVSQGITKDDWDLWVEDRENQAAMGSYGPPTDESSPDDSVPAYGMADLSQYGSWSDVPGEGYGWTPTWMGAGWAPFANGQWCWYPGWGYTWISAEPWGWMPYHYGGWTYVPGRGWVWFPGPRRKWSPGQVTWFHGPDWVGWIPRARRKDSATACDDHCGGGVVSNSTFRQGGRLTANLMLGINPTTGELVKDPGVTPSLTARLPGTAVSLPAARSQTSQGKVAHAQAGARSQAIATPSPGSRNPNTPGRNSAIVYDPQKDSYVNGYRVSPPQQSTTTRNGSSAPTPSNWNPGVVQPVPVTGRAPSGQAAEIQRSPQPNPGSNSFVRQAPAAPPSNPSGGQASGSHVAESHFSSGASSGGHSSPPPAGGSGHAGGGGVSGGHH